MKTQVVIAFLLGSQIVYSICGCTSLKILDAVHCTQGYSIRDFKPSNIDFRKELALKKTALLLGDVGKSMLFTSEQFSMNYKAGSIIEAPKSRVAWSNSFHSKKQNAFAANVTRYYQTELTLALNPRKNLWVFDDLKFEFKMNKRRNKHVFLTLKLNIM